MIKSVAFAALLAMVPTSIAAETDPVLRVTQSDSYIAHVRIRAGTTMDIALPDGEMMPAQPIIGDPRWVAIAYRSGSTTHLSLKPKPGDGMDTPQLLTIPSSRKALFLVVTSSKAESSHFKVIFFAPQRIQVATQSIVTPARPRPQPTPRILAIKSCDALDHAYHWSGDRRIDVWQACDDGHHSFFIMRDGRNPPGAVLYRVDTGGHQDTIRNVSFMPGVGEYPPQYVADGVGDKWALVADSSTGQIRTSIEHGR